MESLVVLKALADESRLAIFRLLLERESYSEVIAERLKLAPSTVSFHLKKLTQAGLITSSRDQYYTFYKAVPKIADLSLKTIVMTSNQNSQEQDEVENKYKDKILKSFFKYGKLVKIPTQKIKRDLIVAHIADNFQPAKSYSVSEAEFILSEIYKDPCILLKEIMTSGQLKIVDKKLRRC